MVAPKLCDLTIYNSNIHVN